MTWWVSIRVKEVLDTQADPVLGYRVP